MKIQAGVPTEVTIDPREILRAAAKLALAYVGLDWVSSRLVQPTEEGVQEPTVEVHDTEAMRLRATIGREIIWKALRFATEEDLQAFKQHDAMMEMTRRDNVERLARANQIVEERLHRMEWAAKMRRG